MAWIGNSGLAAEDATSGSELENDVGSVRRGLGNVKHGVHALSDSIAAGKSMAREPEFAQMYSLANSLKDLNDDEDDDAEDDMESESEGGDDGQAHGADFDLPAMFGGGAPSRRKRRRTEEKGDPTLMTPKATGNPSWEQHTKGIGSRLLKKMGFSGRLGKREDGIAAPVHAKVRPEKLGLGAGGYIEKTDEEVRLDDVRARMSSSNITSSDLLKHQHASQSNNRGEKRWMKRGVANSGKRNLGNTHGLKLVDLDGDGKRNASQDVVGVTVSRVVPPKDGQVVIDMRGAEPITVGSVSAALLRDADNSKLNAEDLFEAPEVVFNLHVLTDTARADAQTVGRRRATEELLRANADTEQERLRLALTQAESELYAVQELEDDMRVFIAGSKLSSITSGSNLEGSVSPRSMSAIAGFASALSAFAKARSVRHELDKHRGRDPCGIRAAMTALAEPWLAETLSLALQASSRPPDRGQDDAVARDDESPSAENRERGGSPYAALLADMLGSMQPVLGDRDSSESYMRLVGRTVLVPLQRHVSSQWDPRNPEGLVDLVGALKPVWPSALLDLFLEDVLTPRLIRLVAEWPWKVGAGDGGRSELHTLVIMWLPVVGYHRRGVVLSRVMAEVRQGLSRALREWGRGAGRTEGSHGAYALVAPWKPLLSKRRLESLLSRHVVPRLGAQLTASMERHPLREVTDAPFPQEGTEDDNKGESLLLLLLGDVLRWRGLVSDQVVGSLLTEHVFHGLVGAMQRYLFGPTRVRPRAAVAAAWYMSWKQAIPGDLQLHVRGALAALLFELHAWLSLAGRMETRGTRTSGGARDLGLVAALARDRRAWRLVRNGYCVPVVEGAVAAHGTTTTTATALPRRATGTTAGGGPGTGVRATFRDTLRGLAAAHGLGFAPTGRMLAGGRTEYALGAARVAIDGARQVLLVDAGCNDSGGGGGGGGPAAEARFVARSVADVLRMARGGGGGGGRPSDAAEDDESGGGGGGGGGDRNDRLHVPT